MTSAAAQTIASRADIQTGTRTQIARDAAMIAESDICVADGRVVNEAAVDAWIDSIGTEQEKPVPYSGR